MDNQLSVRVAKDVGAFMVLIKLFAAGSFLFGMSCMLFEIRDVAELLAVVLVLLFSVVLVAFARKNSLLLILATFMAYANFSAIAANYFASYYDWYMYYARSDYAATSTYVLLCFMAVLILFFPNDVAPFEGCRILERCSEDRWSRVISVATVITLIVISYTQSSWFFTTSGRAWSNQIYEYSYILFIVGYYLSGGSKICRGLLTATALMFIAQAVLGGNRASVLAIVLILYVVYIASRWPLRWQVLLLLGGFLFFQLSGVLRQNIGFTDLDGYVSAVSTLFARGLLWDTAAAAYHQGIVYIRFVAELDPDRHVYYIAQWLLGTFLGGSVVPDSILSAVTQHFYGRGFAGGLGGGYLPMYAYCYFSIPGVAILGAGVSIIFRLISQLNENTGDLACMVSIALFSTAPRWWLYSPFPLTRGLALIIVIGFLASLLGRAGQISGSQMEESGKVIYRRLQTREYR